MKYTGKNAKAKVMADFVSEKLELFCSQNSEFKQAVEQGGTFDDCMDAIASQVGTYISDDEVLKMAVEFYFPTAKVTYTMAIDLGDGGFSNNNAEATPKKMEFSLEDLI